ncbi:MAG: FxsA family protein [Rhizobiales bacterium]|nr:FxsA family protein [Hyphomicrobiales bacterium]
MTRTEKQTTARLPIGRILLITFVVMPLIEIAVLIQVGSWLGLWPTLGLIVLTAIIGTWMLRRQGFAVLARAQRQLAEGGIPIGEVFEGLCLVIAGALLLTPGFVTDAIGGSLLVPPVRAWHQPLTAPVYLAFALMTGLLAVQLLLVLFGVAHLWISALALAAILGAGTLKVLYWRRVSADRAHAPSVASATGLASSGLVRMLDPAPHPDQLPPGRDGVSDRAKACAHPAPADRHFRLHPAAGPDVDHADAGRWAERRPAGVRRIRFGDDRGSA